MSKASTRAQAKYAKKAYDRISLTVKKGMKEEILLHAAMVGDGSLNGFINRAIRETMEHDLKKVK